MDASAHERAGIGAAFADRVVGGQGHNHREIARELGIDRNTVAKWRSRFVEHRLDGLTDEPRPGRPRTVTDEQVEEVIVRTLETTPKDATHWSTRSMAREVGLTQSAVHRIWKAFGLQPHRQQTWKLSKDPLFVDKVKDVVGLYLDPPEKAVVLSVDESGRAWPRLTPCGRYVPQPARRTGRARRHASGSPRAHAVGLRG